MNSSGFLVGRLNGRTGIALLAAAAVLPLALAFVASPGMAVSLSLAAAAMLVTWRSPFTGLLLLVISIPVQALLTLSVGPAELTVTKVLLPAVVGAIGLQVFSNRSRLVVPAPAVLMGLYLLALLASSVAAKDRGAWAGEFYRWGVALVVLVAAATAIRSIGVQRAAVLLVAANVALVVVLGSVAIGQFILHAGPPTYTIDGITRAFGSFGAPNPFALWLELTVPPVLAIAVVLWTHPVAVPPFARLVVSFAAMSGVAALLLTQSRGGYLGLLAIAFVTGLLLLPQRIRGLGLVALAIGVIALLLIGPSRVGFGRLSGNALGLDSSVAISTENFAARERYAHWQAGWSMMAGNPWTGVGAGNFDARYREYTSVWRFRIPRGHAHSSIVQAGAQAGLPGLAAYLAFLIGTLWTVIAAVRRSRLHGPLLQAVAVGLLATMVAVTLHGLVDYVHVLGLGVIISLNLAFSHALLAYPVEGTNDRA